MQPTQHLHKKREEPKPALGIFQDCVDGVDEMAGGSQSVDIEWNRFPAFVRLGFKKIPHAVTTRQPYGSFVEAEGFDSSREPLL